VKSSLGISGKNQQNGKLYHNNKEQPKLQWVLNSVYATCGPYIFYYIQNHLATNLVIGVAPAEQLAQTSVLQLHHDDAVLQPTVPCSSCPVLLHQLTMGLQLQLDPVYAEVCCKCSQPVTTQNGVVIRVLWAPAKIHRKSNIICTIIYVSFSKNHYISTNKATVQILTPPKFPIKKPSFSIHADTSQWQYTVWTTYHNSM